MEKQPKCRLASVAFLLACLSLVFSFLTAIPALICGIVALVKISKSANQLLGKGAAITSIVLSTLLILATPFHILLIIIILTETSAANPMMNWLF